MTPLKSLFESKTFWVALLAAVAAAGGVLGFDVPTGAILAILTPVMIFLGASGWQEVAKMKAAMMQETQLKLALLGQQRTGPLGEVHASYLEVMGRKDPKLSTSVRSAQSGKARLSMMITTSLVMGALTGVTVGVLSMSSACATAKPVATDVIDCAKAEAAVVSQGFSVMQVVDEVIVAFQKISTEGLVGVYTIIEGLIAKYGGDIVACAIDNYPTTVPIAPPGTGSGSGSGSASTNLGLAMRGPVVLKSELLAKYFPGKQIKHAPSK